MLRVDKLSVDDQIVFVGVSSAHRAEAFAACDFIMDYLKSRAAFWKKEITPEKEEWVEAKQSDEASLKRWT
ncbi:Molybdopterin synthase catalytic subunit [Marinomonas gallaica]|uniref:Molybdopterin synthase catalytic subunit n=1 Tax=Marinomonas gallaica TaxID=1806667 RepID=A0A1C3JV52_9GAMM|nr:Molybdopterin synthase catalytic subunit [Marinomonas gallaica]SBT21924.1 Molybdopterin synthase catalytic subunit [Marinomonas gallaica]